MLRPAVFFLFAALVVFSRPAFAGDSSGSLETRYAVIHYSGESQLSDFLWRITGKRMNTSVGELTRSRVDEIIEKVMDVLDMRPAAFHIDIYLEEAYRGGAIAYYSHESRSITAVYNRVTDGVLAHEIAHAIMNAYFGVVPPEKTQEILAQYVDQNLWSEV